MDEASNEFKFAIAVCLLWPQIAKNKLLGLLQLLEARELGESISDIMPTPGGVSRVSIYQISE